MPHYETLKSKNAFSFCIGQPPRPMTRRSPGPRWGTFRPRPHYRLAFPRSPYLETWCPTKICSGPLCL